MNNLRRDKPGALAHIAAELRVSTESAHTCVYRQEPEREKAEEENTISSSLPAIRQWVLQILQHWNPAKLPSAAETFLICCLVELLYKQKGCLLHIAAFWPPWVKMTLPQPAQASKDYGGCFHKTKILTLENITGQHSKHWAGISEGLYIRKNTVSKRKFRRKKPFWNCIIRCRHIFRI